MPPVEELVNFPVFHSCKERYRAGGEGGPLGVGRCSYSIYKDVLVNPTVQSVNLESFVDGSVSSLLEHCLGWEPRDEKEEEEELTTPLLSSCSLPSLPTIRLLCQQGCDPNQTTSSGRSALHVLLSSRYSLSVPIIPIVRTLLDAGASLDQRDTQGNTPLLSVSKLLERKQFIEAAEIAQMMLTRNSCDVNQVNEQGRSLLSFSVTYLDDSAELTRILINHGARVWPGPAPVAGTSVAEINRDKEQSAFTWFLRAVINQRGLSNSDSTLNCLCHEMGRQPARMKSHVIRVMLSEGKYPRVLGPVFMQLKLTMAPFWTEPQHLRYLAWNSVRRSLGPKRLGPGSQQLGLPTPLTQYLTLSNSRKPNSK